MPRIKKRLSKKKAVRRVAKPKPQQVDKNKLTPEQQARENDMLKVLLNRQQPQLLPGSVQQSDRLREQLDTINRRNIESAKELTTLKAQLKQENDFKESLKQDMDRLRQEAKDKERLNRMREQGIKEKEKVEERVRKQDELSDALKAKEREFDESTEEGKHKAETSRMRRKIKAKQEEIDELESKKKRNTFYAKYEEEEEELEKLNAQSEALGALIESDKFKNARANYINTQAKVHTARFEQQHQQKIADMMMETANTQAQIDAHKKFIDDLYAPQPIPERNKNGTIKHNSHGQIVYQKDKNGEPIMDENLSKIKLYEAELADQLKLQNEKNTELVRLKAKIEGFNNLVEQTETEKIKAKDVERELEMKKEYLDSNEFKRSNQLLTRTKRQLAEMEEANKVKEQAVETGKKLKSLEIRNRLLQEFDPTATNPEQIQIQIQSLGDEATKLFNKGHKAIADENRRQEYLREINGLLDTIKGHYKTEGQQKQAYDNTMYLIEGKVRSKINPSIDEWSLENVEKGSEFIRMLSNLNPDILLNDELLEQYKLDPEYTGFEWIK